MDLQTRAAEVIGGSAVPDFRGVTIDRGSADGLDADMAVIAPAGVVGRVVTVGRRAAKVQLLIDRNAAAGARTERTRAEGIVMGTGDDLLRMEYVGSTADVAVGDAVVTSGTDGIFPKGFAIGKVEAIERVGTTYTAIKIRPAVGFSSLEEVLVVTTPVISAREVDK
jgi:rod shape-determining protein MreC